MQLIVSGLGRMGMQIAHKLAENGHEVVAHNRSPEKVDFAKGFGAKSAYSKAEAVKLITNPTKVVWVMVPHEVFENELNEWLPLLSPGDIIVDAGNSNYNDSKQHAVLAKQHSIDLLDCGTSGGILGYSSGFCLMVGGGKSAFDTLEPALATLAAPYGGYSYVGESGSGHFVKMVHNAIEYGMMESIAEGFNLLKEGPYKNLALGNIAELWQHGSIVNSTLNGLTADALKENPDLQGVSGYVAQTGEAMWALDDANKYKIEMPAIKTSFDVRIASQQGKVSFTTKLLAMMRNKLGGHSINK